MVIIKKLILACQLLIACHLTLGQSQEVSFQDKLAGALYAAAIADGMGAPVEGWHPDRIKEQFPHWDFTKFLPPTKKKNIKNDDGKGNGRITDDVLAIEALIRVYNVHKDHLDAYDYAELFIREISKTKVYIPERKEKRYPIDRPLFWPERYIYHRLVINQAEPRSAGIGNWLNNGFSSFTLPTGAINVGDPWGAYDEVACYGVAHTESFGLEAGAVNAAAFAEAFSHDATISSVIQAARMVAKDGTKLALEEALSVTDINDDMETFHSKIRQVYLKYAQLPPDLIATSDPDVPHMDKSGSNVGRPSRTGTIENLPVAFAALKYGQGDYMKTLETIIYYGRDCESIALIATGLLAAMRGKSIIPSALREASNVANQRDFDEMANTLHKAIQAIHQKDKARMERKLKLINKL